ncbi:hypothetical protein FA10DRAFT_267151 [Acaromyces ingoldii]|uniref:C2 domain-containing protein n=1 Tax=Acaromyces ingoldii TaxID=215250 RepID=A0A316YMW2_9BASI|nr:hypothetical protein FA10DRAFT_267151 [Acaromyces ingoldii]PWN90707.1 hypothetical protein FA10DRAFT_267151 [Acaromyces ingoldii]
MSSVEPVHRGTLVCVVLKAKNLPNKRSIGKQDPYCTLQMGTNQQKTKPDKRGGQHPTWDEQLHFEIYDDMEDQMKAKKEKEEGSDSAPSSISKAKPASSSKTKGAKVLRVTCYADDNKEPEFIGEGFVDLAETLKTGEFDEWVTIKAKDRYAGEVYLELTFYSSAAPPKKKKAVKPVVSGNTTYGGAGTFSEDIDDFDFAPHPPVKQPAHAPIPSSMRPSATTSNLSAASATGSARRMNNSSGMTSSKSHAHLGSSVGDGIPSSLRPSSSLAQIDAYTPPYAPSSIHRAHSPAPPGIPQSESVVFSEQRRRESFPPPGQPVSSRLYGHRLPDAAPPSVVAEHVKQNSSQFSQSFSHAQMPSSASNATLRQSYSGPYSQAGGDAADDLVRPMSSMSFNQQSAVAERPLPPPTPQPPLPPAPQPQLEQTYQQHSYGYSQQPPLAQAGGVDQFGRPIGSPYQLAATPQPQQAYAAVTPPPHPNSAPPAPGPPPPQNGPAPSWPMPSPAPYPGHSPAPTASTLTMSTSSSHLGGPYAPAPPQVASHQEQGSLTSPGGYGGPPQRPLTAGGYHALPPPPTGQSASSATSLASTAPYNAPPPQAQQQQQQQTSPPRAPSRPLPATGPPPSQGSIGYNGAPSSGYYGANQGSHYVPPPTTSHWAPPQPSTTPQPQQQQQQPYQTTTTATGYPPPPPSALHYSHVQAAPPPPPSGPPQHSHAYPPPPPQHHYSDPGQPYHQPPPQHTYPQHQYAPPTGNYYSQNPPPPPQHQQQPY